MRVAAYVGTSVALAASVVLRAAYERPNFYSACVYLSQSNACLMILTNLVLLCTASLMYGLQRLLYGPLRPMEIERLYEHAWFAVTETLLAMTIFRDDVGVWFFVMFVSLIAGKIWQWIGAGRVEFVEQQPPTSNEVFFHSRLASSLVLSIVYDMLMLGFCVDTVLRQARPNMIVMFGFEYALLLVASIATFFRHMLVLCDLAISAKQAEQRRQEILEERRAERRRQREAEAATEGGEGALAAEQAAEDIDEEVDDNEIDVPGWEGKGRWIFYLDLATDLVKLIIYMAFFIILMTFHGLPIHIMRDVLLTFRSFHRRIYDFLRYRNATRDMNTRYPDATQEDLGDNNICIICREEMRPWIQQEQTATTREGGQPPPPPPRIDERHRAKKLPCGHCLHISCLRSWLERQQACPTCRQPVLAEESQRRQQQNRANQAGGGAQPGQPGDPNAPANDPNNLQIPGAPRIRHIQLGPIRIGYGIRQNIPPPNPQPGAAPVAPTPAAETTRQHRSSHRDRNSREQRHLLREALARPLREGSVLSQTMWLDQLERRLMDEIQALNVAQNQLYIVRALQAEYMRLRNLQTALTNERNGRDGTGLGASLTGLGLGTGQPANTQLANPFGNINVTGLNGNALPVFQPPPQLGQLPFLTAGDAALPEGLTLPPEWTLLPLERSPDGRVLHPGLSSTGVPPQDDRHYTDDTVAALQVWDETMRRTLRDAQARSAAPLGLGESVATGPTTTTAETQGPQEQIEDTAASVAATSTPSAALFITPSQPGANSSSTEQTHSQDEAQAPVTSLTTASTFTGSNDHLPSFAEPSGSSLLERLGIQGTSTSTPTDTASNSTTTEPSVSVAQLENPFADPVDEPQTQANAADEAGPSGSGASETEPEGSNGSLNGTAKTAPAAGTGFDAYTTSTATTGTANERPSTEGQGTAFLQPSVEEDEDDGT